ncbi:hypothetical protein Tco_0813379 [Tanacetum coccineum]
MVNTDSPKVRKDHKSNESSNPFVEPTKEAQVSHISDAKVGPLTFKRRRLMKNGCFVFKNVVEKIHSDDEKTLSNTHMLTDGILEDEKSVYDVALENNDNLVDDEAGVDIQHSESVSDEDIDAEDDLDDFIDDAYVDDDATDDEDTDHDF